LALLFGLVVVVVVVVKLLGNKLMDWEFREFTQTHRERRVEGDKGRRERMAGLCLSGEEEKT
jgi:hypothetical protein